MKNDDLAVLLKRLHNAQLTAETVESEWGKQYWAEVSRKLSNKLDEYFR